MNSIRTICLGALTILLAAAAATAQPGTALEFDGNDHVIIDDPVDVRGPLTVEAWIRPDALDGGRVFSNRSGGGFEIDDHDGRLRFTINGNVKAHTDITAHQGTWVHIAVTWAGPDEGTIVVYLNGTVAVQELSHDPMEAPAGAMWIGSQPEGSNGFTGAIDELRIFSAALDHETIAIWHTRAIDAGHPFHDQLEAAWCFEEGAGQTVASSGTVAGRDGVLGDDGSADDADPLWIGSGITPVRSRSLSEVKSLFR